MDPIQIAYILATIQNISRFDNPCQVVSFAGLDPKVRQSGQFKASKTRISKRGNHLLPYALTWSANNIRKNSTVMSDYYLKKRSEGKSHYNALGHCAKKVVNYVFFILNNPDKELVLDVGMMILQEESIRNMTKKVNVQDYHNKYVYIESKRKSRAILTVCPTGIQTAEKFQQLLLESLPKKVEMEIISHEFDKAIELRSQDKIFDKYDVQYIVGTVNPQIPEYEFIPIEELIEQQNLDKIKILFDKQLDAKEIELFGHNILRNFSLQNLLEYLTILNPEKIVNYTEEIIQEIKNEIEPNLGSSKIVGLYIHISCLIERLVTDKYITKYENIDEFRKTYPEFIKKIKHSFFKLENNYCVEIPTSEIAYIHDFIYRQ